MPMSRAEWLEERRHSIGGSDAAAVVGMNPYVTPYMLWADKTGRLPPKEDNEAMRQGRDLEWYVAQRFSEATGKRVHTRNGLIRNPDYPFAHATIDRKVSGEHAGLECKTTSAMSLKRFNHGEYPEAYYAQCIHYLAVTGFDRWYLAVLVFGQGFRCFTIERDEGEIRALMEAEKAFWEQYVIKDIPPPVDGLDPTGTAISAIYAEPEPGNTVELFDRETLIRDYLATKELIRMYERENEVRKQRLQEDLGDAENGYAGKYAVIWKQQSRDSFDFDRFSEDHPEIPLTPYYRTSTFRKFEVKEAKG